MLTFEVRSIRVISTVKKNIILKAATDQPDSIRKIKHLQFRRAIRKMRLIAYYEHRANYAIERN